MIDYNSFTLDNGLKVLVHEDHTSPLAVLNIVYNVGSRDEHESMTGFAHLFEHLMFGGSKNIPSYDEPLQNVGGENNAFTSPDVTNYYLTLPSKNIETGFWLESDRMLSLSFDPNVLEVQRKVVIEEFKQRYLDQPYGDVWLKLRPLAYKNHPYRWATIGKEISHIENAKMDDVRAFFNKFYIPNNATLVVAGDVKLEDVKRLSEKWFGPIPSGKAYVRNLPIEAKQIERRVVEIEADVPADSIYKVFHMPGRVSDKYSTADLMSDVLGRGKSSRLYTKLVKKEKLFSSLGAYVMGSLDPGLMVVNGKLNEGIKFEEAESAVDSIISDIRNNRVNDEELFKVKNQAESTLVFSEIELLSRAMNLAFASNQGDPSLVNQEAEKIQNVTAAGIQEMAKNILRNDNSSVLYYKSNHEN